MVFHKKIIMHVRIQARVLLWASSYKCCLSLVKYGSSNHLVDSQNSKLKAR